MNQQTPIKQVDESLSLIFIEVCVEEHCTPNQQGFLIRARRIREGYIKCVCRSEDLSCTTLGLLQDHSQVLRITIRFLLGGCVDSE